MEEIGLFEAIYSQRQITRYKPDPVPREAIDTIIDAATKAPNGGNTHTPPDLVVMPRALHDGLAIATCCPHRVSSPYDT